MLYNPSFAYKDQMYPSFFTSSLFEVLCLGEGRGEDGVDGCGFYSIDINLRLVAHVQV